MFCRSLFVLFLLVVLLSVLRITDSDYPFGIFKLFLYRLSEFNAIFKEDFSYISSADRKTKIKSPLNIRCPTIQHIFPDFKI
jgi:hypothetical protein